MKTTFYVYIFIISLLPSTSNTQKRTFNKQGRRQFLNNDRYRLRYPDRYILPDNRRPGYPNRYVPPSNRPHPIGGRYPGFTPNPIRAREHQRWPGNPGHYGQPYKRPSYPTHNKGLNINSPGYPIYKPADYRLNPVERLDRQKPRSDESINKYKPPRPDFSGEGDRPKRPSDSKGDMPDHKTRPPWKTPDPIHNYDIPDYELPGYGPHSSTRRRRTRGLTVGNTTEPDYYTDEETTQFDPNATTTGTTTTTKRTRTRKESDSFDKYADRSNEKWYLGFRERHNLPEPFQLPGRKRIVDLENMALCRCPRVYWPVCATNNITYLNYCIMECLNEDIRRYGPCINYRRSGVDSSYGFKK